MGKIKREKKKPKSSYSTGASTSSDARRAADIGNVDQVHVSEKEPEIQTVIEQLQSYNVEEKLFGLHSLATIFEEPETVNDVLQHKIVKLIGPMLLDKSLFVRNASAGALRNLSACGSHAICDLLVEQDVMTPLSVLIQQYANDWTPSSKKTSNIVDEQVDTFVQSVHLLWNLCETNSRALKYFNDGNLLPILVKCVDHTIFGMEASIAVAHCLNTVTEDNPTAIQKVKEFESKILQLMYLEGQDYASLLLKTLSCGLILNMNQGKVVGIPPTIIMQMMKCLSDTLDVDQRLALNAVTSDMPSENEEKPAGNDTKLAGLIAGRFLLEAQQTAVEILANLCSDGDSEMDEDDAMDQDLSDNGDEMFCDSSLVEPDTSSSVQFSSSLISEVHEAIISQKLVAKVWQKTIFPATNVCFILSEHKDGKSLFKKVSTLRCRALLCLNNLVSGLDIEDIGGPDNLYKLWLDISNLIFKEAKAEDTELLEAATAAMRAALQRLAELKTNMFEQLVESDLQLMFNGVLHCVDTNVRANLIRSIGTLGLIITHKLPQQNSVILLKNIGRFLLEVTSKESELWVVAETLDTIMDVFSEDETDGVAADINLVDKLNSVSPNLKYKIRLQRKSLGDHYLIVTTVNTNLSRFIKYKADRISGPRQSINGNHTNGHGT